MRAYKDLTGKQFGRLIAMSPTDGRSIGGCVFWKCLCSCGTSVNVISSSLITGNTQSCGCLQKETTRKLRLQDVSGIAINGIQVLRMSTKKAKISRAAYCFAICPICKKEWEVQVTSLKRLHSTQCRNCTLKQRESKTATTLLNKLENILDLKIEREHKLENRYFDGYIPELKTLIESDSPYWHKRQKDSQNDRYKEQIAKTAGLRLIRVKNDSPADHEQAIEKILTSII